MKIDAETYLVRIHDHLKAQLNLKIAEINAEKADAITLASVSDDAYFLQSLNEKIANYDPYVLIALDDAPSVGIGPSTIKQLTFTACMIVADNPIDLQMGIRMLRYGRCLEEIFEEGFAKIIQSANFRINSLVPIALTSINSNDPYRAVGVEIVAALG